MGTLKNNKVGIMLIYINLLFIFRIMEICYSIRAVSYGFIFILFALGTIIFMFYHSILKTVLFKTLFTMLILISLLVLYFINSGFIQIMMNNWLNVSLVQMNNSIYESLPTYFYQYKPILIILIPLLIVIYISLAVKNRGNIILFFSFAAMLDFWYTGYSEIIKLHLSKWLFIMIITYYCNKYMEHKRLLNKRGIKSPYENGGNIVYVVVIIFCISILITLMPQEAKGKYNSNLFTKWNNAFSGNSKINDIPGEKLKYDIALSGYDSGDKRLGGVVSIDNSLVFKVKSDKPYYLKGIVKDFYDGHSWTKINSTYLNIKSESEKIPIERFSEAYFQGYNLLTVYPEKIRTSTFFTPTHTYNIRSEKSSIFYDYIPNFLSNDFVTKPYTVDFYNEKANIDFTTDINYLKSLGKVDELTSEFYAGNYQPYLQLPENLNPDIYKKVYSITKDCKNNFEKVKKIKEYLFLNYKYSLNVSEVPKDKEFLDYFLNVEKKGYCTYFATATTIFCRIAGIPARYVEGFNMTNEKDSKGLFMVTNENAHAWTEVLLLISRQRGLWYTLDSVPNATEEIQKIKKADLAAALVEDPSSPLNIKKRTNTKNNLVDTTTNGLIKKKLSKASIASIIFFSSIMLLIIIRHVVFAIKKSKIIRNKSIIPLYNYSLKRLQKVRIKKLPTDTDMEFVHKINESYLKDNMNNMVGLCYEEFYGNKEVQGFDKVKYYEFIERFVKSEQNPIKYYFVKYIF